MIDDKTFDEIMNGSGIKPVSASGSWYDNVKKAAGITDVPEKKFKDTFVGGVLDKTVNGYKDAGNNLVTDIKGSADQLQTGVAEGDAKKAVGGVVRGGLRATGAVAGAAFAPVTATLEQVGQKLSENQTFSDKIAPHVQRIMDRIGNTEGAQKVKDFIAANPEKAKDIADIVDIATLGAGSAAEKPIVTTAKETIDSSLNAAKKPIVDIAKKASVKATNLVDNIIANSEKKVASLGSKNTIVAIDPTLKGKTGVKAYEDVVRGNRKITPAGLIKESSLSPSQRAIKTGERLSSGSSNYKATLLKLENDLKNAKNKSVKTDIKNKIEETKNIIDLNLKPLTLKPGQEEKNLIKLRNGLKETEDMIKTELQADPELVYNLDKQTAIEKINSLKGQKPGDFIGDNGKIYDKVIDFGKQNIANAEDTIAGGRAARTAFDNEVKRKFPTAFKNGAIDQSTPAGNAIQKFRDAFNEHIYDTAPNGSKIKHLIQRESDILYANENISPKAFEKHGTNKIERAYKFIKERPITTAATTAAAGYGAAKRFGN